MFPQYKKERKIKQKKNKKNPLFHGARLKKNFAHSRPPFFSGGGYFFLIDYLFFTDYVLVPASLFFFPGTDMIGISNRICTIQYITLTETVQTINQAIYYTSQPSFICKLRPKSKNSIPIPATMRTIFPSPNCCCPSASSSFSSSSSSSSSVCCGV